MDLLNCVILMKASLRREREERKYHVEDFAQKYQRSLFLVVMQQFKRELNSSSFLAHTLLLVNLAINASSLCDRRLEIHPLQNSTWIKTLDAGWYISVILTWLLTAVYLRLIFIPRGIKYQYREMHYTPLLTPLMHLYPMVAFPLMCQSQAHTFGEDTLKEVFGWFTIALGVILCFLGLVLGRNTISSTAPFAVFENQTEFWMALLTQTAIIFDMVSSTKFEGRLRNISMIITNIILLLLACLATHRHFFRWKAMRTHYLTNCYLLFMLKLFSDLISSSTVGVGTSRWGIFWAMFLNRLADHIVERKLWVRVFDTKGSSYYKYCALIKFMTLHCQIILDGKSDLPSMSFHSYIKGQLIQYCERNSEFSQFLAMGLDKPVTMYSFFVKYFSSVCDQEMDCWKFKALLQSQILLLMPSITTFRTRVFQLEFASRNNIRNHFEAYHLRVLLQVKIDGLYYNKVREEASNDATMANLYSYISTLSEMSPMPGSLNIAHVLTFKNKYLAFVDSVTKTLADEKMIFEMLASESTVYTTALFMTNLKVWKHFKVLAKQMKEFFSMGEDIPTYYYAGCVYYLGNVRKNMDMARKLMRMYMGRISKWELLGKNLNRLTTENIQRESVVIQVDLQKEKSGEIKDITPDYKNFLGLPADTESDVLGSNINDLFPSYFSEKHREMMLETSNFMRILNVQRFFTLNGFDGFLRKVHFAVKIHPSIESGVTGLTILRVMKPGVHPIMILRPNLEVIAAEEALLQDLSSKQVKVLYLTHLAQLSKTLAEKVLLLYKYVTNIEPLRDEILHATHWRDSETLLNGLEKMRTLFADRGFLFTLDPDSMFYENVGAGPFRVHCEIKNFSGLDYIQIRITFGEQVRLRNISDSGNDVSNYKLHNRPDIVPDLNDYSDYNLTKGLTLRTPVDQGASDQGLVMSQSHLAKLTGPLYRLINLPSATITKDKGLSIIALKLLGLEFDAELQTDGESKWGSTRTIQQQSTLRGNSIPGPALSMDDPPLTTVSESPVAKNEVQINVKYAPNVLQRTTEKSSFEQAIELVPLESEEPNVLHNPGTGDALMDGQLKEGGS